MKLYELKRGDWFHLTEDAMAPPDIGVVKAPLRLKLGNIDGMYSFCTDTFGNIYHPAAWSEVEKML